MHGNTFVLVFVLMLFFMDSNVTAMTPGMLKLFNRDGIAEIARFSAPSLVSLLQSSSFDNYGGTFDEFAYTLSNLYVTKATFGRLSLTSEEMLGIHVADVSVELSCEWEFHGEKNAPFASGTALFTMEGGSLDSSVTILVSSGGYFMTHVQSLNIDLPKVSVSAKGDLPDAMYTDMVKMANGLVKKALISNFEAASKTVIIDKLVYQIGMYSPKGEAGSWRAVDLSGVSDGEYTKNSVVIGVNGEVKPSQSYEPESTIPRSKISIQANGRMVQLAIDKYTYRTNAKLVFKSELFHYSIVDGNRKSYWPLPLQTNTYQDILPALYTTYPNLPMRVQIQLSEEPVISVKETGLFAELDVYVRIEVLENHRYVVPVILRHQIVASLLPTYSSKLDAHFMHTVVSSMDTAITVSTTTIGQIDLVKLAPLLDSVKQEIEANIPKDLFPRYSLPLPSGIVLANTQIDYVTNAIMLSADFTVVR